MPRYVHVSQDLHDRCLLAAIDEKDKISEAERSTLDRVAAAWACNDPVHPTDRRDALNILARLGR